MSRRARAAVFLGAAILCAVLAAVAASRYRSQVEGRYGPLRPALVASANLPAGEPIAADAVGAALVVRRAPVAFVPPGTLKDPREALGLVPTASISSGSYVVGSLLAPPQPKRVQGGTIGSSLRPLQVPVAGAEALTVDGEPADGRRVDVVVSRQAGLGDRADARVAATNVELLALQSPANAGESWSATLAVSEREALELIGAVSAGREIRLLPRP